MTRKICSSCNKEKELSEFRKDKTKKTGYQSHCKICARAYHKSAYTEKYSDRIAVRNKTRADIAKQMLNDYKSNHPCIMCGESCLSCLDFHHKDPLLKDFTVSQRQNGSLLLLMEEVQKCVVVCRNCHAKIHAGLLECRDAGR